MTWGDAFKRALAATLWMILFLIVFLVLIFVGMAMGTMDLLTGGGGNIGTIVLGWILIIIGYIGLICVSLAVGFKFLSEAVADTVLKRLQPPAQQNPPK
jgi:hypothetical protein